MNNEHIYLVITSENHYELCRVARVVDNIDHWSIINFLSDPGKPQVRYLGPIFGSDLWVRMSVRESLREVVET